MALLENVNHSFEYLFTACEQGDFQRIKIHLNDLSSSEICSIRDENQASLVHYASRYGQMNILKYLIETKGIDVSQLRTKHGSTCVHDAAVCDQVEVLRYIFHPNQTNIYQKLRWTVRDEQGNTPLHLAASYNSLKVLRYLLNEELSDGHNRCYNGYLPIHNASSHGHCESVQLLLLKCPDTVNEQTNQLLTPIHLACQYGSLDTILILISHGANLQLKNQNGFNSLHIVCQYSHLKIVQWLIEKQNMHINELDYTNRTPIHHAATSGNEDIIFYLLEKNAKISVDNHGNTPLHVAAEKGHQRVCVIFIERNSCSLNVTNRQGFTPADLAEYSGYPSLANQLRLRANSLIQLQNAAVVRLVIKKRNVPRSDASSQVTENDLFIQQNSINDQTQNIQSKLQKIQLIDREDISTTTNNHHEKINGFTIPSTAVAISKYQLSNKSSTKFNRDLFE